MGMSTGGRGTRTTMSEINVTPFVDVMLVLLIMFMVTAPLMQQGIEVNLPKTAASGVEMTDEPLVMSVDAKGQIFIAKNRMPLHELRPRLQAILQNRKNKQVFIQADRKVDYGQVAEIMAEIRAAGIFSIGLITLPKDK